MTSLIDHTYLISARMRNFTFDEMTKFSKGASTGEGYALLPNVDMCNGYSAQQQYGAAFSKNSVFAGC